MIAARKPLPINRRSSRTGVSRIFPSTTARARKRSDPQCHSGSNKLSILLVGSTESWWSIRSSFQAGREAAFATKPTWSADKSVTLQRKYFGVSANHSIFSGFVVQGSVTSSISVRSSAEMRQTLSVEGRRFLISRCNRGASSSQMLKSCCQRAVSCRTRMR